MGANLHEYLVSIKAEGNLVSLIELLAQTTAKVSRILHDTDVRGTGTSNVFGDSQLSVDIKSDLVIFDMLAGSGLVSHAASEESPVLRKLAEAGEYIVLFDPLDGSSIADCNWAVGSIFGVYKRDESDTVLGRSGNDQVLSAVSMYGPRTTMIVAIAGKCVFELTILEDGVYRVSNEFPRPISKCIKVFSPANLRSTNDLPGYAKLVEEWMKRRLTLRYTGGMVPDVVGILIKGNGIFCSPVSQQAPAKLRLVFECAPIALIVETAGGLALTGTRDHERVLERVIRSMDDRVGIICGSSDEVEHAVEVISST